jgi:hypothetical protein
LRQKSEQQRQRFVVVELHVAEEKEKNIYRIFTHHMTGTGTLTLLTLRIFLSHPPQYVTLVFWFLLTRIPEEANKTISFNRKECRYTEELAHAEASSFLASIVLRISFFSFFSLFPCQSLPLTVT